MFLLGMVTQTRETQRIWLDEALLAGMQQLEQGAALWWCWKVGGCLESLLQTGSGERPCIPRWLSLWQKREGGLKKMLVPTVL